MAKAEPTTHHDRPEPTQRRWIYIISVIVLVIIVVTFVGGPALSGFVSSGRLVFGEYNGTEIEYIVGNYFQRTFQNLADRAQESETQLTSAQARQVWRRAFESTVLHIALLQTAEASELDVTDEAVDEQIASWPQFQENGRFSNDRYQAFSGQQRSSLREYLHQVLVSQQVQLDMVSTSTPSAAETEFFASLASPERQFQFVAFAFAEFPESEVISYLEENAERFRRANLSRITITSSEAEAEQIRQQAADRIASFEDLASAHSTDQQAEDGGDLGWVYYHELEPDFEDLDLIDTVFSLDVGSISPVLETAFGWAIYRLDEGPVDADPTDEELIVDARSYLTTFERGLLEDYMQSQADAFRETAIADGFDAAAASIDQTPQLTSYFPINYGNFPYLGQVTAPSATSLSNAAYDEEFFVDAFSLADGDVSEPIVLRDRVLVMELEDEREASDESTDTLQTIFPFYLQQIASNEIQRAVIDQDLLTDRFNQTYNRQILGVN